MNKTYLVGKIGKSLKFNQKSWGAIGGDNEAPTLLRRMAELNKEDTFIVISKNDISNSRKIEHIPENIISVYENASKEEKQDSNYIVKRLENVKIDGCFLISGPVADVNIKNKLFKRRPLEHGEKVFAKSLETFSNYVAPIYNYLNESMIPWTMIVNDPRYIQQGRDLLNLPTKILSQYNDRQLNTSIDNWEDQNLIKSYLDYEYAGVEKMCAIGKPSPIYEKTEKFKIVLNEGNNGVKSRYPELKKYVLDYIEDVDIYGKWDPKVIGDDKRFKGSVKFSILQERLKNIKYTFIIPIKPGWVTSKYVEMISFGIIPFFHPEYDSQHHCNVPEYIRIKNPQDLHQKIEDLENDPKLYDKILKECLSVLDEEDFSGRRLNKTILDNTKAINQSGKDFRESLVKEALDEW